MENTLTQTITQIIDIFSTNKNLNFNNNLLPKFLENKIETSIGDILPFFSNKKSKFSDKIIELKLLKELIKKLTKDDSLIRVNHIGFCYKVSSSENEKNKIIDLVKQTNLHLYQEESNDDGLWFFIGNVDNWEDPTIELLPIESTNDKYIDYWLPHIQIDIDTKLTGKEIENIVESVFDKERIPFPIKIDDTTYIIRNRLGVVDGINIFLDLATNSRRVKYSKQRLWKKIE